MIYFECQLLSSLGGYSSLATDGSSTMQNSAYANLGKRYISIDNLFNWHIKYADTRDAQLHPTACRMKSLFLDLNL